jgi:hypothetical protein
VVVDKVELSAIEFFNRLTVFFSFSFGKYCQKRNITRKTGEVDT